MPSSTATAYRTPSVHFFPLIFVGALRPESHKRTIIRGPGGGGGAEGRGGGGGGQWTQNQKPCYMQGNHTDRKFATLKQRLYS